MKGKPTGCQGCAGYRSRRYLGFVADELNPEAKVLLLCEAPDRGDVWGDRPLASGAGRLLEKLLPPGKTRRDLTIGSILRCHPQGDFYPTGDQRWEMQDHCRRYHSKAFEAFKPTIVGVTWNPSFVMPVKQKVPQAQPFLARALESAFMLAEQHGERPCLCLGDKAFHTLMPHLRGGVKKWQRGWWRL